MSVASAAGILAADRGGTSDARRRGAQTGYGEPPVDSAAGGGGGGGGGGGSADSGRRRRRRRRRQLGKEQLKVRRVQDEDREEDAEPGGDSRPWAPAAARGRRSRGLWDAGAAAARKQRRTQRGSDDNGDEEDAATWWMRRLAVRVSVFDADLMSSEPLGAAVVPSPLMPVERPSGRGGAAVEAAHALRRVERMPDATGTVTLRRASSPPTPPPLPLPLPCLYRAAAATAAGAGAGAVLVGGGGWVRVRREAGAPAEAAPGARCGWGRSAAGILAADRGGTSGAYAVAELVDATGEAFGTQTKASGSAFGGCCAVVVVGAVPGQVQDRQEPRPRLERGARGVGGPRQRRRWRRWRREEQQKEQGRKGDWRRAFPGADLGGLAVQVTVFDKDTLSSTVLGRATLPLGDLLAEEDGGWNGGNGDESRSGSGQPGGDPGMDGAGAVAGAGAAAAAVLGGRPRLSFGASVASVSSSSSSSSRRRCVGGEVEVTLPLARVEGR